ncbi:MAG: hypothetical protein ACI89D_001632, partial [Bermanella sp.]
FRELMRQQYEVFQTVLAVPCATGNKTEGIRS